MQTSQDSSLPKKPRRERMGAFKRAMEFVNLTRGRALTEGERLDILALHANLRADTTAIPRKESVTAKISRLLRRSNKTVGAIWFDSNSQGSIFVADPPANRSERATKIPRSHEMRESLQAFIRNRCESWIRTACKDVMHFLVEGQFLRIELTDPAQVKTAQRQVQRFVKDAGCCRGEHNTSVLRLSSQNSVKRAEYVQLMTAIKATERRIVYMDESYIHNHHTRHAGSLYDPSNHNSVKLKHKARRLCCVAAIIDHDRSVHASDRTAEQQARLLLDTADVFEGGKRIKDYHGMFNNECFVKWMEMLLLPQAPQHRKLRDRDGQQQVSQGSSSIHSEKRQQEGCATLCVQAIRYRGAIKRSQTNLVAAAFRSHHKVRRPSGGGDGSITRA